ncbi:response regulator [Spirosoma koreense]
MTILLADDHPMIRMSLRYHLIELLPEAIVITCESFTSALAILDQQAVDLAVLDIDMPGSEYSQMIHLVREKQPHILILIYSGLDEKVYALPYLQAGANGFLSKNAPESEFAVAITTLLNQDKYVSREVHQLLINKVGEKRHRTAANPFHKLSQSEQTVLQLLTQGKWTKDIAVAMNLKENTVSTYKKRIFEKLEVNSLVELMEVVNMFKHM